MSNTNPQLSSQLLLNDEVEIIAPVQFPDKGLADINFKPTIYENDFLKLHHVRLGN
jgi:hypothetical protein